MSPTAGTTTAGTSQSHARVRGLGYDVFAALQAAWTGGGASTSTGHRRVVRTVDSSARDIRRVPPLPVVGFADGVQTQFHAQHEEHRPISLVWVAAGAVSGGRTLLEFRQRLELVASGAHQLLSETSHRDGCTYPRGYVPFSSWTSPKANSPTSSSGSSASKVRSAASSA